MGFSWSSYVTQSYLLERCYSADLEEDRFLSDEKPAHSFLDQSYGLAPDDLFVFTRNDAAIFTVTAQVFDDELDNAGVVRAPAKDVTFEVFPSGVICVGIDACDCTLLAPSRYKFSCPLVGCAHLLTTDALLI